MFKLYLILLFLLFVNTVAFQSSIFSEINSDDECKNESEDWAEDLSHVSGPLLPCDSLNEEWFECEDIRLLVEDNITLENEACPYFGERNGVYAKVNLTCRALPCIECLGSRQFQREVPCIKYSGHYYLTALLYSIFLGIFAIDRFYLGYSAMGIGKLITLGGFGVWWIADLFLLIFGSLKPADDSNWEPWQPY